MRPGWPAMKTRNLQSLHFFLVVRMYGSSRVKPAKMQISHSYYRAAQRLHTYYKEIAQRSQKNTEIAQGLNRDYANAVNIAQHRDYITSTKITTPAQ